MVKRKSINNKTDQQENSKKQNNLDKFVYFFEQQNSKASAKNLMWTAVIIISIGILFFTIYASKLQISAFSWDNATVKIKNDIQKQWENSFENQEKEKNISEIKKQVLAILEEISSSTPNSTNSIAASTTASTVLFVVTTTNSSTIKINSTKKK